jgi:hypothetical protein
MGSSIATSNMARKKNQGSSIQRNGVDAADLSCNPGRVGRPSVNWDETHKVSNYIKFDNNKAIIVLKGSRLG